MQFSKINFLHFFKFYVILLCNVQKWNGSKLIRFPRLSMKLRLIKYGKWCPKTTLFHTWFQFGLSRSVLKTWIARSWIPSHWLLRSPTLTFSDSLSPPPPPHATNRVLEVRTQLLFESTENRSIQTNFGDWKVEKTPPI